MNWIKTNRIVALLIFLIALTVYFLTAAPAVSFWDCGEFIACSFKMAVPHPPGAPLFLLLGRIFSLLPFAHDIAFRINTISVISSALTIMLLYLTIVHLVRAWKGKLENDSEWLTAIFSGVIGSLTFAFSHSFWFNAVEAEVYAMSMLFTSLLVWLILVWAEKSDEPGNERYLLMIAYFIGLAIAVHLLNVLALPFVAMIFYYKKFDFNLKSFLIMTAVTAVVMLAVYPGIVKYIPKLTRVIGFPGLALAFLALLWAAWWSLKNGKKVYAVALASIILIMIGYSSYGSIYIRSNLNPNIDENNPETLEKFISYIEREQYGDHSITDREGVWKTSPNARKYTSTSDYFWNYQVNKMYNRYFLWNFVGLSSDEANVDFGKFFMLPLLLGLFGIYWQFRRDPKRALAVLALFFMTGLAIVLYLNQPDPQPRERDYSYVGSFFAFSIWVGLGFAGIIDMLKEFVFKDVKTIKLSVLYTSFALLVIAVPGQMLAKDFHRQDRTGNYVAWDYSYNMLQSCEPNAILFTNGDNDTFPLWYLQEVEGIRTDVRIVNLSLLNTDWYIYQLRDMKPKVPMRMSNGEIDHVGVRPWKERKMSIKVPAETARRYHDAYVKQYKTANLTIPDEITFDVKPAVNSQYGGLLRTQDMMIMNIITANQWKQPIYFAVTVPRSNMVSGLANYFRMDGLVMKLVPYKNWELSDREMKKNLLEVYQYRGLNDPSVYLNSNILSLLQNYRHAFVQLADFYSRTNQQGKIKQILEVMDKKIDPSVIPWTNQGIQAVTYAFRIIADSTYEDSILANDQFNSSLPLLGEHLLRLRKPHKAERLLEKAYELNPVNPRVLGLLLNAYEIGGHVEKSISPLEQWLELNPQDKNAKRLLESIKGKTQKN